MNDDLSFDRREVGTDRFLSRSNDRRCRVGTPQRREINGRYRSIAVGQVDGRDRKRDAVQRCG
jgi:hypothetical protein